MTNTHILHPDQVALNWHVLAPQLQRALDHGYEETPLTEWLRRIICFEAYLWYVYNEKQEQVGLCLTKFIQYANYKTCHLVAVSGVDFNQWGHLHEKVQSFAIDAGCVASEIWGRPGWQKTLPKVIPGFYTAYHVYRKDYNETNKDLNTTS